MEHFLTVGVDKLSEQLFWPIDEPTFGNPFKPYAGLWLTKQGTYNYNDWVDHLSSYPHLLFYKYANPTCLPASLVTLKPDAKIFNFSSKKDLEFLQNNYPCPTGPTPAFLFSYNALAQDYDGIFFEITKTICDRNFSAHESEQLWALSVNSLVLFNLNCILYYQKALVHYTQINFDDPRDEVIYTIHVDDVQRLISKDNPYDEFITALCAKTRDYFITNGVDFTTLNTYELSKMITDILKGQLAGEVKKLTLSSSLNEAQINRMLTRKMCELKLP